MNVQISHYLLICFVATSWLAIASQNNSIAQPINQLQPCGNHETQPTIEQLHTENAKLKRTIDDIIASHATFRQQAQSKELTLIEHNKQLQQRVTELSHNALLALTTSQQQEITRLRETLDKVYRQLRPSIVTLQALPETTNL